MLFDEESAIIEEVVVEKSKTALSAKLPSIFLVGPMGAGKTTVGKLLAKHLGRDFIDCDWYIAEQTGADIPWIFEKEGEAGFRDRETKALTELVAMPNIVMATGGGAVVRPENRTLLKQGLVIYLEASVETQLSRTKKDKNRPLLQNDNPRAVLKALYEQRSPLYQEVATITIATGKAYPKQMVQDILQLLSQYADTHSFTLS